MTDQELVQGCIQEDRNCQKALWDKYARKLLMVSQRYCRAKEDAEDVVMESFIKIFDNLTKFKGESSLETWMRRIVINNSINKLRAEKITQDVDEALPIGISDKGFDDMNVKELMAMLNRLPQGYKNVFNLFAIEGFSHKEIAETLGIDEGTSRSQLNKARKALQEMIHQREKVNL